MLCSKVFGGKTLRFKVLILSEDFAHILNKSNCDYHY